MRYVLFVVALVCASVSVSCSNHLLPQIYSLHVTSKIQFRYARTLVTSRVANPARIPQEVTFAMVIPDTAFISGFLIEDDDHVYKAYIREKEAAKREYAEAVKQGRVAGYVGLNVRDSNLFTVSVNLGPRKKISFNLTYEELLVRTLGVYKHVINLDPGNVVQEFNVEVHIDESSDITALEVPALTIENEINLDPTEVDYGFNSMATIERTSPRSAVVRWSPTPEEQLELASYGVRGQLIVRYDVDRKSHPHQILVNEGYFVHFFAPTDLPTLQKQVTFVLDVSASMEGRKLHQLKEAMHTILSELRSTDFFSLVTFSSRTSVWNASNYKTWMTKMRKKYFNTAVVPATDENKRNAKLAIDNLEADGATNINKALKTAMHIARLGKKLLQLWTSDDLDEPMHPEPMIIFLTDGAPTEGKIKPEKIVTSTSKWNRRCRASIFTLALGNDADFPFLKKLALLNYGFARKIYEASHTALQLVDFYRQIASPLLANVTFNYQARQVEYPSLTKHRFSSFYSGSELVVAGHLHASSISSKLRYEVNARSPEGLTKFQPLESPLIIKHPSTDGDYTDHNSSIMERLWAYLSIQQMLDRADSKTNRMSFLSKQALQLALKYSFVTPVTSLLVVKPNGITDFAVLKSVVKTQPAPANMDIDRDITRRTGSSQIGRNNLVRIAPESNIGIEEENSGTLDMSPPTDWIQRWHKKSATTNTDSELEATTIVDFSDIDWLIAFTVGSQIFLPFGSNSTVEVVGPGDPLFLLPQDGGQCTTPERERGRCRHLRACPLNTFAQNFTVYQQYFCTIGYSTDTKYAGTCCPYRLSTQYA